MYDAIIIGAGASGMMAALTAAKRGLKIVILEHKSVIAGKVAISGGGRCNFTNLRVDASHYFSENPHFVKSAIAKFRPDDFIKILDQNKIEWEEKEEGQLFCKKKASEIISLFKTVLENYKVKIVTGCKIMSVKRNELFKIKSSAGEFSAKNLIVATGGLSYPSLGASDLGLRIAKEYGHKIVGTKPGLTAIIFNKHDRNTFHDLAGLTVSGLITTKKHKFKGSILFTHSGLSGPAILNASLVWEKGEKLRLNFFDGIGLLNLMEKYRNEQSKLTVHGLLYQFIPKRLARKICSILNIDKSPFSSLSDKGLRSMAEKLENLEITPAQTDSYNHAEVTVGGISTDEISSKTMESRLVPGLYFIGEVIDVVGMLGGYNLHWAWASGFAAGNSL